MSDRTLDSTDSRFVRIRYRIHWNGGKEDAREVEGFAFETPGFPEFRACVRMGNRLWNEESPFDRWLLDHFDTGLAVSIDADIGGPKDAPALLAAHLKKVGRKNVRKALRKQGVVP